MSLPQGALFQRDLDAFARDAFAGDAAARGLDILPVAHMIRGCLVGTKITSPSPLLGRARGFQFGAGRAWFCWVASAWCAARWPPTLKRPTRSFDFMANPFTRC